jgi:hypothetical protein
MSRPLDYLERKRALAIAKQQLRDAETAEERWLAAIATHQAEHARLTYQQSSDAVRKSHATLYDAYVWEQRHPGRHPGQPYRPVTKQAAPSYETILKQVTQQAQAAGVTRDTVFASLLAEQEGTPAFPALHKAYRQFHATDGVRDRDAAALGQSIARDGA